MRLSKIKTPYGLRYVVRCVGPYVYTCPIPSAPHGEWWTLSRQRAWRSVPSNAPSLRFVRSCAS